MNMQIFRGYSRRTVFMEIWKHMTGYYMEWKKIVRWTLITKISAFILIIWMAISFVFSLIFGIWIIKSLNGNGSLNGMGFGSVFVGNYQKFINQGAVTQSILLKFMFYVFFIRNIWWSLILIMCIYMIKAILFSSIISRSTTETPLFSLAMNVGLNPFPKRSYQKMKDLNIPNRKRTIDFTKIFNDLMNLQSFPKIEKDKALVESKNLSFNYESNWFIKEWMGEISQKYFSKYINSDEQNNVANALENINLVIKPSRFTSILGCNGSSKSTLLKAIINLFEDYSGEISWVDKNLKKISHKSFYRNVAYIAQETIIQNKITVYDYVACGLLPSFSLFRFSYPKDHPLILENLEKMGLLKYRDKNINSLSGGEKQKVILARVLTQKTEVIILDEPTTYLDIKNQYLILNLLKKLQLEENKTIITILHDIKQAEQFSDEIILLDSGRIYASGKTKEVINRENIEGVFGIPWK